MVVIRLARGGAKKRLAVMHVTVVSSNVSVSSTLQLKVKQKNFV